MLLCKLIFSHYVLTLLIVISTTYASIKWFQNDENLPEQNLSIKTQENIFAPTVIDQSSRKKKNNLSSNSKASSLQKFGILVAPAPEPKPAPLSINSSKLTVTTEIKMKQLEEEVLKEEAKACMRKARLFAQSGNRKLANKLFRHALALAPKYSEVLNEFGEFLEKENVVQADMMFQRAISYDPTHSTALLNRRRTAPVVAEYDRNVFALIDAKKKELYKYSSHHPKLRSAMKEFYYQHIYHTVALEGNTLTLEQIKVIIDQHAAIAGKSIFEHNEVIGVAEALNYMNNTLLMKIGNITINDIKNIHKRVLGFVDPFGAGEFRTNQVYVGRHIPPHPNDVEIYMEQFEEWLNSAETISLHPVEYAAIAHYKLVYIHPFVDGNGRTARLLMNFILMKNGFPPVSIEVEDRWEYYECLIAANDGDIRPFVRFIAECTYNTLEMYLSVAELPYLHMSDTDEHSLLCQDDRNSATCKKSDKP